MIFRTFTTTGLPATAALVTVLSTNIDDMRRNPLNLARRATEFGDPGEGLAAVASLRSELEGLEAAQVDHALRSGWSWRQIAQELGVSKQAAHKKHAKRAAGLPAAPVISGDVRRVVALGRDEARALGAATISPEHLLLGLLDVDGRARRILHSLNVSAEAVRAALEQEGEQAAPARARETLVVSAESRIAVEHAVRQSRRLGNVHLGPEHLLLGLVREGSAPGALLERLGCSPKEVERLLLAELGTTTEPRRNVRRRP
jgi:hypothetical protein